MSNRKRFAQPRSPRNRDRRWPGKALRVSPRWCAVDLRDGNQALPHPLTPSQKLEYFKMLTEIGFKEIEIGFPASSRDDWNFCRELIEGDLIPSDVLVSVLTQARPHIIRQTLECMRGARTPVVIHVYVATSQLFTQFVLHQSHRQIREMATSSVRLVKELSREYGLNASLEFSPEEFTDSNLDFVVDLCDAVVESWEPSSGEQVVINLPETVERALPLHYADMVECFCRQVRHRRQMVISLHAHNDMGGAVADVELALQAGGERVEGTLFGHGERAGNVDLVTLALNFQYLGLETGLDFSRLEWISERVSELTSLPIPVRQPYAGELAFTAFSGSHQDAINKCLGNVEALTKRFGGWKMPYMHIDPSVLGRSYQEYIRITSQSGKGGIGHVLKNAYGVELPGELLAELAKVVQRTIDNGEEREYAPQEIWDIFLHEFDRQSEPLRLLNFWPRPDPVDPTLIHAEVHVEYKGQSHVLSDTGKGPVAAFAAAIRQLPLPDFVLLSYDERAIGTSVNAQSITMVKLQRDDGADFWGVGFGGNIVQGAAQAIISGLNRILA